jgi:DNA-binding IclR family transcriptional regulator
MAVLWALDGAQPMTASEIARKAKLPTSTAHRVATAMSALGMLERLPTGRFAVGSGLYELGNLAPRERILSDTALPLMGDLFQSTRSMVQLAVLKEDKVLYVAKLTSMQLPRVPTRIGGRMPAYSTALGKSMLATTTHFDIDTLARGMKRYTPNTITNPDTLLRELERVRQEGVSYDRQETQLGVMCVAAPVTDSNGTAIAAISVATWLNDADMIRRMSFAVREVAGTLSRQLQKVRGSLIA